MNNQLKSVGKTDSELRVGNYIILFGGKDLTGEFFTKNTAIDSAYTKSGMLHVDFEHGLDPDQMGMDSNDVLGYVDWKTAKVDDTGVFVERVLNRQARYMSTIERLIDEGHIGTSSESIAGKVGKTDEGEIINWPLVRDTLTFTPAEPRMLKGNSLHAAKTLRQAFPNAKSLADVPQGIEIKAAVESAETLKDIEAILRDSIGVNRTDACVLVSRIKSMCRGDLETKEEAPDLSGIFQQFGKTFNQGKKS